MIPVKNRFRNQPTPRKQDKHKINQYITAPSLRLVGENIEKSGQIYDLKTALLLAEEQGLDLVETSPNVEPPIAKIIDYKKFLYLEEKKQKDINKKQKETNKPVKEIQFTPNIGLADIETKTKQIREFLIDNHKVKITVKFKQGREIQNSFKRAEEILYTIQESLEDVSKIEFEPKLTGKNMIMNIAPKKK